MPRKEKKIVKIIYFDHVGGQGKGEDYKRITPLKCTIYGEVCKETDDYLTVVSYREEKPDFDASLENFFMTIVKSTIIERRELVEREK